MKIPDNMPKGYSWIQFTFYGNHSVKDLMDYVHYSELSTSTDEIVQRIQHHVEEHPAILTTPAGFCLKYILDHPEIHHLLKEVNDGSYRLNRIFICGDSGYVDTHEQEIFHQSLRRDDSPTIFPKHPQDEEGILALYTECIHDGVLFIQWDTPTEDELPE